MPQALVIPSIFTIIDDVSPRMNAMQHNVSAFGTRSEQAAAKADRAFKRLTPGLGAVQSQLLSMVGTGAILAAGFQLGSFSFGAAGDYEAAVDQFRVIVSDLNDSDFKPFQDKIDEVAKKTKRSGTEVAQAFEQIASKNAKFAQTADGLGQVTQATITLSKAAKMDLGVAAENLVGIMNQFSFGADKADRTINVLAAGQAVGAASITQTAEAFTNLGPTAASANVTIEESVALIQTLAKFSLYGADAGTALRGSIIKLQKAGLGYKSGQFSINDALDDTNKLLGKLHTAKQKDALITAIFGIHNITAGRILATNRETYHDFTKAVTGTSEAQKGAAINSANLKTSLAQLSAGWVNIITGSAGAKDAVTQFSNGIDWVEKHLEQIVSTGFKVGKTLLYVGAAMLAVKTYIVATTVATTAINVAIGVTNALFTRSVVLTYANATAQKAYLVTSKLVGGALNILSGDFTALGAAMAANPVGAVLIGVTALAAGIAYLSYRQSQLNEEYEAQSRLRNDLAIDTERKAVDKLTEALVKNGIAKKEAIALSIQQRMFEVSGEISNSERRIRRAQSVMDNNSSFSENYQAAERDKATANQDLVLERYQSLALKNEAIRAAKDGLITDRTASNLLNGEKLDYKTKTAPNSQIQTKELDQTSQTNISQIQEILKGSMNLTLTVNNNSDGGVGVASGKSKLADVQPKTVSTKILTPAYGR